MTDIIKIILVLIGLLISIPFMIVRWWLIMFFGILAMMFDSKNN